MTIRHFGKSEIQFAVVGDCRNISLLHYPCSLDFHTGNAARSLEDMHRL